MQASSCTRAPRTGLRGTSACSAKQVLVGAGQSVGACPVSDSCVCLPKSLPTPFAPCLQFDFCDYQDTTGAALPIFGISLALTVGDGEAGQAG